MDTYDTDRAGLVSTAQLALEQSKHEGHARRQAEMYVPWPKLLLTVAVILALTFALVVAVAGMPPVDFNPWVR